MADEEIINRKIKLYKAGLCINDLFFLFSASSNVWLSKHLKIYRPDDQNFYRETGETQLCIEDLKKSWVSSSLWNCNAFTVSCYDVVVVVNCLPTLPEMKRHVFQHFHQINFHLRKTHFLHCQCHPPHLILKNNCFLGMVSV